MRLTDYLTDDSVLIQVEAVGAQDLLEAFSAHLEARGVVSSRRAAADALLARERAHTTALGDGVAVPHATLPELNSMVLMVATTTGPVPFGPPETDLVDVFFVLLSPPGSEGVHIKLLARICRLVRHPGFLDEIRAAPEARELLRVIARVDAQHV